MLVILGALYAVSSLALLIWFLIEAWHSASLMDRLMQVVLLASGAWGLWLMSNARENLRERYPRRSSATR